MKRRLVLRRIAEKEFDNSMAWYESQREGLGREFRAAIEQYFERIAGNPKGSRKSEERSDARSFFVVFRL